MQGINTTENNFHMYLALRASTQSAAKCYHHLTALTSQHPAVSIDLAGVTGTEDQFLLTLDIDLGLPERIAEPSEEAVAGYAFVTDLMEQMFEYLPQYSEAPDETQRLAATNFKAAFTTTQSAAANQ